MLIRMTNAMDRVHEAADRVALEAARKVEINQAQTYIETYKSIVAFFLEDIIEVKEE